MRVVVVVVGAAAIGELKRLDGDGTGGTGAEGGPPQEAGG